MKYTVSTEMTEIKISYWKTSNLFSKIISRKERHLPGLENRGIHQVIIGKLNLQNGPGRMGGWYILVFWYFL